MGNGEIIVFSTVDSVDAGERIADALVTEHLAACVNMAPGLRSVYYWEGKLCHDAEMLLIIKTVAEKFAAVRDRIQQLHSYQLPEVIAIPVVDGDARYLDWLRAAID